MSINLKTAFTYKGNFIMSLVLRVGLGLLMVFVWTAVFLNAKTSTIRGFTLPQMYAYFFLLSAIGITTMSSIRLIIQNDVQQGKIATSLLKPINYPLQTFYSSIPMTVVWSVFVSIPLVVLISIFVHFNLSTSVLLLLILEMAIAISLANIYDFLLGTLAINFVNIWGIAGVFFWTTSILEGGVMPLNLFPTILNKILMFTPFPIMGYTPAATVLGTVSMNYITTTILAGLFWIAVLLVLSIFRWRSVVRKITVVGG
jgi:ABC-2 type transport system permease protein